ncbi:MAG: hypothetical protein Q8P39_02115 [Candidatus Yanofskybacteria bacterium]|nr:hypothetical protein [Candidatus Yanofskybacteria bacterium]
MRTYGFFFVFGLFLATLVFLSLQYPLAFGRGVEEAKTRIEQAEEVFIPGSALFISDLHLKALQKREISLDAMGAETIVILGDFFDSEWDFRGFGDTNEERVWNGLKEFLPEGYQGRVYFISAHTHDPDLEQFSFEREGISFIYGGKMGKFTVAGTPVIGFHGNELAQGWAGGGIAWSSRQIGIPLPLERLAKKALGIDEDTWLIAGHSHVPAFHEGSRTANTGSFAGVPFNVFFQIHVGTGILVDAQGAQMVLFQDHPSQYIFSH